MNMAFVPVLPIHASFTGTQRFVSRSLSPFSAPKNRRIGKVPRMSNEDLNDDYVYNENKPLLLSDMDRGIPKVPGFTDYSELLNGRAAMIGFIAVLAIEAFTKRGFLSIVADLTGK